MRNQSLGSRLMVVWATCAGVLIGAVGCSSGSETAPALGHVGPDGGVGDRNEDGGGLQPIPDATRPTDGKGGSSAASDAGDAADLATDTNGSCTANQLPCGDDGGTACCFGTCSNGMCGSCLAEGTRCRADQTCCNGLACSDGYCGTDLCVPDTTPCTDPSVVCCNDNCNNGKCGG